MTPTWQCFGLIAGHFICDYVFQSDTMAREKNAESTTALQETVPWYYWMTAHALTHAVAIALITANPVFVLIEFVSHFAFDHMKCRSWISLHVDQLLHLTMKVLYGLSLFGL